MKKNLLKSKMSLHEDNNKTLAHKLKITPSAFSRKINGSSNFTIEEMKFIRKEYGLSDVEFLDIFFNQIIISKLGYAFAFLKVYKVHIIILTFTSKTNNLAIYVIPIYYHSSFIKYDTFSKVVYIKCNSYLRRERI